MKRIGILLLCAALLLSGAGFAETDEAMDILKVDHRLYELGYRDENCNGRLDEPTVSAIRNFQLVNGLAVTGEPDAETVRLLMSDEAMTEKEYLSALAYSYNDVSTLTKGSEGEKVQKLQFALQTLGYFTDVCDSIYGDSTEAAVYCFQLANGMEGDGVADGSTLMRLYEGNPPTWKEFLEDCVATVGDSGSNVRMLQMRLKKLGYYPGTCTAQYGEGTQAAVKSFQTNNALDVNGIANAATCAVLYSNRAAATPETYSAERGARNRSANETLTRLIRLGYPAGGTMNAQTEIAVMEFQLQHGIPVTGTPDAATEQLLGSETAEPKAPPAEIVLRPEQLAQVNRVAESLIGKRMELTDPSELVLYVYLKAGVPLTDDSQMPLQRCGSMDEVQAGDVVLVDIDDTSVCGIATSDGAVIYCGGDGYVVKSYPDPQNGSSIFHWRAPMAQE